MLHLTPHAVRHTFGCVDPDLIARFHKPQTKRYAKLALSRVVLLKKPRVGKMGRERRVNVLDSFQAERGDNLDVGFDVCDLSAADEDPLVLTPTHSS